jgi:Fe-S-cluster-containing dehydrogenase component
MDTRRRNFLKSAAAGTIAATCAATAEARGNKEMPPQAVGLLYDGTLCIGCKACVAACKESNHMPAERTPLVSAVGSTETLWDAPLDLSGKTLNVIKAYVDGDGAVKDREVNGYAFTKFSCYHCADPSCVSACPVSAMKKDPVTGIVSYNKDKCIGCRYCVAACPFGVPRFTYDTPFPVISKCQLCRHRMDEGKYAACAEVCPTGATLFGPVVELKKEIARRKALEPGKEAEFPRGKVGSGDVHVKKAVKYVDHVYGEKEIGGTQVLHMSAVPFDKLGKPELADRSNASIAETYSETVYSGMIAPIALLAGLAFIAKRNTNEDAKTDDKDSSHG